MTDPTLAREADPQHPEQSRAPAPETSPAWELELLVSGVIVVGLFQLPGLIANVFGQLEPHATESGRYALTMLHTYLLAAAYAMIVMFSVHIASRSYWVAMIGLNSVFPRGIDWSKMKTGEMTAEFYRRRMRSLPQLIERLDNFCSIAFSFAFVLVAMLAFSVCLLAIVGVLAWLIARVAFHGQHVERIGALLLIVTVVPRFVIARLERKYVRREGDRILGPAWLARVIPKVLRLSPLSVAAPMLFTLTTNLGRRRFLLTLFVALYVVLLIAFADQMYRRDALTVNAYDYFAYAPSHTVDYRLYANRRPDGEQFDRLPFIQSDVIGDRYVRLFVPYVPSVDNAAIASECPRIRPLASRGLHMTVLPDASDSAATPVLACLTRLHAVTLDGAAVRDPQFSFTIEPHDAIRGIVAYLPVDSLAPGRHVITVTPLRGPDDTTATTHSVGSSPYVIPFWK